MRKFGTVAVVLLLAVVLSGCAQWRTTMTSAGAYDPGYEMKYDYALWPGIEANGLYTSTVCTDAASEVGGREDLCRVLDGYEEGGDYRNWVLDCDVPPLDSNCTISATGDNNSPWGVFIVMQNGDAYEGCRWYSPNNDFVCDYRGRKHVVLSTSSGGNWYAGDFVLRKMWDWFKYGGNASGCGIGIGSVLAGVAPITWSFIAGCVDGPM